MGLFCSNLQAIAAVRKAKSTRGQSANSLYGTLLNCLWWFCYGVLIDNSSVLACNGVGLAIAVWGLQTFAAFATTSQEGSTTRNVSLIIGAGSLGAVWGLNTWLTHATCVAIVGLVASGGSVVLFSAPLASLREIVSKKDASVLTPLTLFFSLATAGLWTLYALLIGDGFMLVPNGLGLLVSIAQLWLFVTYHKPAEIAGVGALSSSKV
jgi:solute carrier family 50 protein (sugar transporter)